MLRAAHGAGAAAVLGGAGEDREDARDLVIVRRQVRLRMSRFPQPLTVIVGWPLGPARATIVRVERMLLGLSGLMLLVTGPATLAMARRALAPLTDISRQADNYSAGDLSRRLPGEKLGDEVGRLAVAFNRLLARQSRYRL